MVKQFDIAWLSLDPTIGKEKAKRRPVLIVSNKYFNDGTPFVWVMPISSRSKRYLTVIELMTTNNLARGIVDTVQLRCVNFSASKGEVFDHLDPSLYQMILSTIQIHTEIVDDIQL